MTERNPSSDENALPVVSPPALILSARHPMGPLAGRSGLKLRVPVVTFTVANSDAGPLTYSLSLDPLERERDGARVEGRLSATHGAATFAAVGEPLVVQATPGRVVTFQLSAEGAFPPGRYLSRLHVRGANGHHLIPATISVSSHWFWSFTFLLLGLLCLGTAGFQAGMSGIAAKKEEARAMRWSLHELLDSLPPSAPGRAAASEADERLTIALEHLGTPRSWSISDRRLERADRELAAVRGQLQGIREEAERTAVGEAGVKGLVTDWKALEGRLSEVEGRFKGPVQGLPAPYDAFMGERYQALIAPALSVIRGQLGSSVEQVRTAFDAGEGDRAKAGAVQVRHWLRNGSWLLDERAGLMIGWRQLCEEMVARQAALEAAAYSPETPADMRWLLRERLKDIRWAFAGKLPTVTDLRELYRRHQQMEADILKLQAGNVGRGAYAQPYRNRLSTGLGDALQRSGERLALLPPNPSTDSLREKLDHLRQELDRLPEGEPLDRLVDLDARLLDIGSRILDLLEAAGGAASGEQPAGAGQAGIRGSIALASRLMAEPKVLQVTPQGKADEWYPGRDIALQVQGLDPAWEGEVKVAVDFGDGSPPVVMLAADLRRDGRVTHRYTKPRRVLVQMVAAERLQAGSITPVGEPLALGGTTVDIGPSPVSAKRELAAHLFNLRVLIALVIGLLVVRWRFYSERSRRPFGSRGRDYAEAFLLSLAIDAGIRGLMIFVTRLGLSN